MTPLYCTIRQAIELTGTNKKRLNELRAFRIHDLRHTFASMLLMAGENPAYVQQQLGHSSLRMTLDIYGHYIPKTSTRRGVDVLDERKEMER